MYRHGTWNNWKKSKQLGAEPKGCLFASNVTTNQSISCSLWFCRSFTFFEIGAGAFGACLPSVWPLPNTQTCIFHSSSKTSPICPSLKSSRQSLNPISTYFWLGLSYMLVVGAEHSTVGHVRGGHLISCRVLRSTLSILNGRQKGPRPPNLKRK